MSDEATRDDGADRRSRLELASPEIGTPRDRSGSSRYSYYGGALPETDQAHLLHYVKVLYKRRWTGIAVFVLVFVTGAIQTFTPTPNYDARVQLLIEKENSNVVNFKEAFEQNRITDDYYQTQYKILQSRG